ncbi:CPBP family intramembrane glutamic endopeptidase [Ekhidna sp.]|uniref:CPBP family intramembrane glutamic endopeptidase n=1 Tax=Ekhidna sp. TaxID=2608089 RepID=UPI003CCBB718
MIGIVVELALSWVILRYLAKQDLKVLGLVPTKNQLRLFVLGLAASAIMCALYYHSVALISGAHWEMNEHYGFSTFINSLWYALKSVLFEEFIFRGAVLYLLISRIGMNKSCWISAVVFGMYHWFSYGIIGNPQQMIFVFLLTGTWGLMFAYAFAKTGSILSPIALHLGWNAISMIVFSQGNTGDQLLIGVGGEPLEGMVSLALFILQWLGLPVIVFLYLKCNPSTNKVEKAVKDDKA